VAGELTFYLRGCAGCQQWFAQGIIVHRGAGDLTMPRELDDRLFPWMFGGSVILIIISDMALIWVLFTHP
jgi:hypothetical protein